jgi:hypothetical protein
MRAAAITLLFLVIGFAVNAVLVFSNPAYRSFLQVSLWKEVANSSLSLQDIQENEVDEKNLVNWVSPTSIQSEELEKTLNRLADGLQALSPATETGAELRTVSWSMVSLNTVNESQSSVVTEVPVAPLVQKSLDLPLFLQAKLYPEYAFKKFDSKSPFGVSVFANLEFATYRDTNRNVRIYVFKDSYATTIANFRMATNVYMVKEVDAFFEKTFFLNTVKKNDGMVRFVILEKAGVYGLEMPKWQYSKIKNYLQSK